MPLRRPKLAAIYNLTNGWWVNAGAIQYVAHGITAAHAAVNLGPVLAIAAGGGPNQHPDQQYWQGHAPPAGAAGFVRIEIDCTLTPCTGQFDGCLYRVPYLLRQAGYANVPLRIFSHREEGMGGGGSSKRYITCNSADQNAALTVAMNNHDDWGWVPWAGVYA